MTRVCGICLTSPAFTSPCAGSSEPTTSSILDATLQPSICTSRSPENIIQLRGYRRSMVNVMAAATAIPHFHLCDDVQLDALIATRDTLRSGMHDVRLSVLPLLIKALSLALVRHPEVNARLGKDLDCLHLIRYAGVHDPSCLCR